MTELLCLLLRPALLCANEPRRYWYLAPVTLLAWVLDVLLAHTAWALAFGWPHKKEWTISDTLERLCKDWSHGDVLLFIQIGRKINRVAGHTHIRAVT